MIGFTVTSNVGDAIAKLKRQQKQVPFATAQALNATGRDIQDFAQKLVGEKFVLRSKWWKSGKYAFNLRRASKSRLEAIVGSQAPWLKEQEEGGTRRPHGRALSVPLQRFQNKALKITTAKKAGTLLKQPDRYFIREGPQGRALFRRLPRHHLKLLFVMEPQLRLKGGLHFESGAHKLAQEVFPQHFQKAWVQAMLTAK